MKRSRSLSGFAILLLLIFGANAAQGQISCDPDDIDGSIACGETIEFRADISGHQHLAFSFDAIEGEVCAFRAEAPLYPEASIKIFITTENCAVKFAEDPPDPDAYGEICPFFIPKSGTYRLGINVFGRRGPLYTVRMVSLDPDDVDCGFLPAGMRTWGQIKTFYH